MNLLYRWITEELAAAQLPMDVWLNVPPDAFGFWNQTNTDSVCLETFDRQIVDRNQQAIYLRRCVSKIFFVTTRVLSCYCQSNWSSDAPNVMIDAQLTVWNMSNDHDVIVNSMLRNHINCKLLEWASVNVNLIKLIELPCILALVVDGLGNTRD